MWKCGGHWYFIISKKVLVKYKSLVVKMVQDGPKMLKIAKVNYELIMCDHVETNVGWQVIEFWPNYEDGYQ